GGRVEEFLGLGQVPDRRRAQPQRAEAEPLDARGKLRCHQARAAPDPESSQPPGLCHAATLVTVRRVVVMVRQGHRARRRDGALERAPAAVPWRSGRARHAPSGKVCATDGGGRVTAAAWEHQREVREALQTMVSDPQLGIPALSNAQAMFNLLKDLLPDAPRETSVLVAAAEAGLAELNLV